MIMLLDDRNSNAIVWNHDGTQFSIRNRELLCSDVLPHYFRSTSEIKYGSFARKLSRWHFTRTSSGLDTRIYFHDVSISLWKAVLCLQYHMSFRLMIPLHFSSHLMFVLFLMIAFLTRQAISL